MPGVDPAGAHSRGRRCGWNALLPCTAAVGVALAAAIPSAAAMLDDSRANARARIQGSAAERLGPAAAVYVALGESYAAGVGASSPEAGYVGRLYADFQLSLGVNQLLNRAQGGATSSHLRNGGQLATAIADINAPSDTRAVTIGIGGNDGQTGCSQRWDDPTVCAFRANLAAILDALRSALETDPGEEIFAAMAYPNPQSGTASAQEAFTDVGLLGSNLAIGCSDRGTQAGLNDVIQQEAGKEGAAVADPYQSFKQGGQALMSPDHVHPNDAGHAAIAQAFREASVRCRPQPDVDPPQTSILAGPTGATTRRTARIRFKAGEPG